MRNGISAAITSACLVGSAIWCSPNNLSKPWLSEDILEPCALTRAWTLTRACMHLRVTAACFRTCRPRNIAWILTTAFKALNARLACSSKISSKKETLELHIKANQITKKTSIWTSIVQSENSEVILLRLCWFRGCINLTTKRSNPRGLQTMVPKQIVIIWKFTSDSSHWE